MTLEKYYKNALPLLEQGEECLQELLKEYPVKETRDGIQPVLYVNSRLKKPESMIEKLKKKGVPTDSASALKNTHDAIGVRVICSFVEEVYRLSRWLYNRSEIRIIWEKDYIAYPKPNGYRSLHLLVAFTDKHLEGITAEIQLRTIAIDFWAVLEHQMKYKRNIKHETTIRQELKRCADEIASVDVSMQTIRDILRSEEWE